MAMSAAGLTTADVAEHIGVDPKTVQRWIGPGRIPHPTHRRAVAGLLKVTEADLWPPDLLRQESSNELHAEIEHLNEQLRAAQRERMRYEEILFTVARRANRPARVKNRHLRIEIGSTPEGDCTTESFEVEAMTDDQPILWWLLATGFSGEAAPPKSSTRQLERFEAHELLDNGNARPMSVFPVGHRDMMSYAMVVFGREVTTWPSRRWWCSICWDGLWNPLRVSWTDHSILHLRERENVEWESVTVSFIFPRSARNPDVRLASGMPGLHPEITDEEDGRTAHTFKLGRPSQPSYTWDLEVRGFNSQPE